MLYFRKLFYSQQTKHNMVHRGFLVHGRWRLMWPSSVGEGSHAARRTGRRVTHCSSTSRSGLITVEPIHRVLLWKLSCSSDFLWSERMMESRTVCCLGASICVLTLLSSHVRLAVISTLKISKISKHSYFKVHPITQGCDTVACLFFLPLWRQFTLSFLIKSALAQSCAVIC